MLVAKLIYSLLLSAIVLVPATPLGSLEANPARLENVGVSKQYNFEMPNLIHEREFEFETACFGISNDQTAVSWETVVRPVTNDSHGEDRDDDGTDVFLVRKWAIGNTTGRELVERITRYPKSELLPLQLGAIPI